MSQITIFRLAGCALILSMLVGLSLTGANAQQGEHADPEWPLPIHNVYYGKIMFDQLELVSTKEEKALSYEVDVWYGGDYNRIWLKAEGSDVISEGEGGEIEQLDLLYSRNVASFWDLQTGIGYQRHYGRGHSEDRWFAVVGFEGLAPYWFEVDSALRISDTGDVSASLEVEYDILFTQRLVLQPLFEASLSAQEVREFGIGRGLTHAGLDIRLRYEIIRELAPYLGIGWEVKTGDTADIARDAGEDSDELSLFVGVRAWL